MTVVGEPLFFGHEKSSSVLAILRGKSAGTTLADRGTWEMYDDERASVASNVLTLKRSGTYKITYYSARVKSAGTEGVGSYTVTVYQNSTSLGASPVTITASANDTVHLKTKSTVSGTGRVTVGFTLVVEEVTA